jgi:hypothetical protein
MSLENLESIDQMLAGFAAEALTHFKPGNPDLPGRIRVFCQQKMIETANSVRTARLYTAEQAMEPEPEIHPSGTKMNGGWGCFLIKRGGSDSEAASPRPQYFVDLYLYSEG